MSKEPLYILTYDHGGYFDLGPVDRGERCRKDICLCLEKMGFEIEASHHENAIAQHEIDFKYDEVLRTADNVMTFKYVVKNLANAHGLYATFMPKPIYGICGSGMHINISLFKDGENAFCDSSDAAGLSGVAYNFIAGVMHHIKAITVLTNPIVNSFKRLVPGYEAPVYIAWSAKNRSPLIRIPTARGSGTRIELRNPDPSANPYLAMAAVLQAGLDGVEKAMTPPPPKDSNIFDLTPAQRKDADIHSLPKNLREAVREFKYSEFAKYTADGDINFEALFEEGKLSYVFVHNSDASKNIYEFDKNTTYNSKITDIASAVFISSSIAAIKSFLYFAISSSILSSR